MTKFQIVSIEDAALEAANSTYASQEFLLSNPERDRTWGVLVGGELIALGRLQHYADGAYEIGGFWVEEGHRGRGLARALVHHALERAPAEAEVWCIPYDHLTDFYLGFGMQCVIDLERVPASIREKLSWCTGTWTQGSCAGTQLLRRAGLEAPCLDQDSVDSSPGGGEM